ncbi:MAG TPA: phosphate regulon sensor histidine kinase PhoR [Rhodocyclaceae bacterium]|nr:phosphate regulon sensor histidine kinase PhoR [Rhodocyclaceae bacterium]
MQPTRSIPLRALLVAILIACVATPLALFFGIGIALSAALALLFLIWCMHLTQLAKLLRWARQPLGTPVPDGPGLWADVFAALYQRSREQREQRLALSETLERFRMVAQTLPDGVVILAEDLTIEWLNTNAEVHMGLSSQRDTGYPITNLFRDAAFIEYLKARQFGLPLELRPLRSASRVLHLQLVPFGETQAMLLTRDVSQREKLETMRRDFVANVSHELKTPLTVVSGFIETLADGLDDIPKEDAKHYLDLAADQAGRMQQLIEDLLILSSLEAGSPPPHEEEVTVAALLADVRGEITTLSNGRHMITVENNGPTSLRGSAKELRSVFGNLASNAVRYTPDSGCVALRWQRLPDGGGEFSVVDSGIGIAAEHIPRLTERFYRVDRGRSRDTGGTGLGLAIVKHALERHQAELVVTSEPGKGSVFSARFPAHRVSTN